MKYELWKRTICPVVKIGHSNSVIIPMHIIKELNIEKGDAVEIKLRKHSLTSSPEIADFWFKVARRCKELDQFTDEKIVFMSRLSFMEGKQILEATDTKITEKLDIKARKIMRKVRTEYRSKIKKEFGRKVYNDFLKFRKRIEPEMLKLDSL